ncbi:MAG TPA: MFS transporter, partial [Jatrophihabitans sp.]|nr:MFS transporter [Jatrophihabitans sp.]
MIESDVLNSSRTASHNVRLYLVGLTASLIGDSAMSVVAGIWTKDLTGSNRTAGLVSVCIFAPSLLAPVSGLLADRFARRRFLVAVNLAAAAVVLTLLAVHGAGQTWLVFVVMTWYGLTLVLSDPAENALLADLLPAERLARMNGLRMTLQEGCKLIAPLAGAGLYALAGGHWVAVLDAASFLVAAACVFAMRLPDVRPEPHERQRWRTEVLAGLRHVRNDHTLAVLTVVGALAMAVSGVAFPAQYALVDALHRPASFIGVLTALLGAGSIVAGLLAGRVTERVGARGITALGCLVAVASYALVATGALVPALISRFVAGAALPWIVVAVITAGQQRTPANLQGRVSATLVFALFATQPVAQAAGALLVDPLGYRGLYVGA